MITSRLPRCRQCDHLDDSFVCTLCDAGLCDGCHEAHVCRVPMQRPSLLDRVLTALARWFL